MLAMKLRFPVALWIAIVALGTLPVAVAAQVEDEGKPRCTAKTRGQMWPREANTDPLALQSAARSGKLEVCAPTTWRYRWQFMTVRAGSPAADDNKTQGEDRRARTQQADSGE
jgi:hypothetical protein